MSLVLYRAPLQGDQLPQLLLALGRARGVRGFQLPLLLTSAGAMGSHRGEAPRQSPELAELVPPARSCPAPPRQCGSDPQVLGQAGGSKGVHQRETERAPLPLPRALLTAAHAPSDTIQCLPLDDPSSPKNGRCSLFLKDDPHPNAISWLSERTYCKEKIRERRAKGWQLVQDLPRPGGVSTDAPPAHLLHPLRFSARRG